MKKRFLLLVPILLLVVNLFIGCSSDPSPEIPVYPQQFCDSIHCADSSQLSKELFPFASLMDKKTGVYVLEDGGNSMIARAWLCENAEKTIDVQYFIFSTDNVGLIACDYLVRAADRGIKVRILVDDIMVDAGVHDILTMDSHENISIKIYNPGTNLGKSIMDKTQKLLTDFRGANQRMHNKTFTVDGKVVITGGRNIADEYFDYDHEYNFRDRDVLLIGKEVKKVQTSFNDFWSSSLSAPVSELVVEPGVHYTAKDRFDRLHEYACNPDNFWPQVRSRIQNIPLAFQEIQKEGKLIWLDSVYFISDIPGKIENKKSSYGGIATDSLVAIIKRAKKSIDIQSPYLITTAFGKKLLKDAVARGVKVRILTNSLASTDNMEAFSGYQRDRTELLNTGVRIFEYKPDANIRFTIMTGALQKKINYVPIFGLHAKSMVVDGNVTIIGTFNFDPRSAYLNTECITVVYSNEISSFVLEGMEVEFKPENSWETTLNFNPDREAGIKKRLKTFTRKVVPKEIL